MGCLEVGARFRSEDNDLEIGVAFLFLLKTEAFSKGSTTFSLGVLPKAEYATLCAAVNEQEVHHGSKLLMRARLYKSIILVSRSTLVLSSSSVSATRASNLRSNASTS